MQWQICTVFITGRFFLFILRIFLFKIKVSMRKSRSYESAIFQYQCPPKKMIPAIISVSTHAYASASHDFSRHDPPRLRRRPFFYGTFLIDYGHTLFFGHPLGTACLLCFYLIIAPPLSYFFMGFSQNYGIFMMDSQCKKNSWQKLKIETLLYIEVLINQVTI